MIKNPLIKILHHQVGALKGEAQCWGNIAKQVKRMLLIQNFKREGG